MVNEAGTEGSQCFRQRVRYVHRQGQEATNRRQQRDQWIARHFAGMIVLVGEVRPVEVKQQRHGELGEVGFVKCLEKDTNEPLPLLLAIAVELQRQLLTPTGVVEVPLVDPTQNPMEVPNEVSANRTAVVSSSSDDRPRFGLVIFAKKRSPDLLLCMDESAEQPGPVLYRFGLSGEKHRDVLTSWQPRVDRAKQFRSLVRVRPKPCLQPRALPMQRGTG